MDLLVDLGAVYDVADCYLNGVLVGTSGRFPPDMFPQTAGRMRTVLPTDALRSKNNTLAIRVYRTAGFGGLVGLPCVDFEIQDRLRSYGATCEEWLRGLTDEPKQAALAVQVSEFLLGAGMLEEVIALCGAAIKAAPNGSYVRQRALGRVAYAQWLMGKPLEAWRSFQRLDFRKPIPYDAAHAAAKCCEAGAVSPPKILYVGRDIKTQGDWDRHYGVLQAILCATCSPLDATFGSGPALEFALATGDADEHVRAWLGKRATKDRRALFFPPTGQFRYASWDDSGEKRPFDDRGPDLLFRFSVPAGPHLISFYLVDFDWYNGPHPRMQTLTVLDEKLAPQYVVATGRFGGGQYERFLVAGPAEFTVRFSKHRSACTVLSGVFVDRIAPMQGTPLVLPVPDRGPGRLAQAFNDAANASARSMIGLVRSGQLRAFREMCAAAKGKPHRQAEVHWWLMEAARAAGDFTQASWHLDAYLNALSPPDVETQSPLFVRKRDLMTLRDFLFAHQYPNSLMLPCAKRLVALEPKRRDAHIRGFRRGSFLRFALRTLK
jgi:hypothetical protein